MLLLLLGPDFADRGGYFPRHGRYKRGHLAHFLVSVAGSNWELLRVIDLNRLLGRLILAYKLL